MTTASGTITYTIPIASARTETGQDAHPSALGSFSNYTSTANPNTGNLIQGWKWDERIWSDETSENNATTLPVNWDPTTSGVTESYFQSGIGSNRDLEFKEVAHIPSSGLNKVDIFNVWSPKINHGYYYDFQKEGYLYSDDSELQFLSLSGVVEALPSVSGFNEVTLSGIPKIGVPISVEQFQWDNSDGKYVASGIRKKIHFTGQLDSEGEELSTWDSNKQAILWDNIDQTEDEFIITTSGVLPKVVLNRQYVTEIGGGTVPSGLEFLGYTDGSANQQFHTKWSPIDRTLSVNIYSYITSSGTITPWEAVDFDTTLSGNQVKVDYDLGILEFGDSTVSGQNIPSVGSSIGAHYYRTFQVEYEPEDTSDCILPTETNINPIYRQSSNGFVYLSTQLEDPASIELRAALPEVQNNVFGPLNIGNALSAVIATVKDSKGKVLEDQTVDFFITSVPSAGSFANSSTASATTDFNGEAKVYYTPPRSVQDIGENITASGWSQTNSPTDPEYSGINQITTFNTESLLIEGDLDNIFLYEVRTDDPLQGYLNSLLDHGDSLAQLTDYYTDFFDEQDIQGATRDIEWEQTHRSVWNLAQPLLFDANNNLGKKKLVSYIDSTALNPHTFEPGAVAPMQPIDVRSVGAGEYDVVFDSSSNEIPEPSGSKFPSPSGTLYSYFLVAPTIVKLQASVFNSRLNQSILSNEISIKLEIPSYLSGLWTLDSINQNHIDEVSELLASGITASGQKVPLGWRLRSSSVTLAAALDGVTFLDVNRQWNYDPWDPDTFSGVSLGHQVNVNII